MNAVATGLAEVLSRAPEPVLSSGSIGSRRPSTGGEMPAIAVSLTVERVESLGLGRLIRSWDQLPDGNSVREETRGDRYEGLVALEVWAGSFAQARGLSQSIEARLGRERGLLREKGFAALQPAGLDAAENITHQAGVNAAFPAWKQRVAYRFVFETREGGDITSGGIIERVDVDVSERRDAELVEPLETFDVP
jgi:hypothetical protein